MATVEVRQKDAQLNHLKDTIQQALDSLNQTWDDIGLDVDSRHQNINDNLFAALQHVIEKMTSNEEKKRSELVAHTEAAKEKHVAMSAALGRDSDLVARIEGETLLSAVSRVDEAVAVLSEEHDTRLKDFTDKLAALHALYATLQLQIPQEFASVGDVLSDERKQDIEMETHVQREEKTLRCKSRHELVHEISDLLFELVMTPETEFDKRIMSLHGLSTEGVSDDEQYLGLSVVDIHALSDRARELTEVKNQREEHLKDLGKQIQPLWEKLNISQEERDAFFEQHTGLGLKEIKACEDELVRLQEMKLQQLKPLVSKIRSQIESLWNELNFGAGQRSKFAEFAVPEEDLVEATLDLHEAYLAELMKEAEEQRPILKSIARRETMLQWQRELKEEPARFTLQDRSREAAKYRRERLKKENCVKKSLPAIEQQLKGELVAFREKHGKDILFNDEPYYSRMMTEISRRPRKKKPTGKTATKSKSAKGSARTRNPGENRSVHANARRMR